MTAKTKFGIYRSYNGKQETTNKSLLELLMITISCTDSSLKFIAARATYNVFEDISEEINTKFLHENLPDLNQSHLVSHSSTKSTTRTKVW